MKDVYTVFNEKLTAIDAAGKRSQFDERAKRLTSVESKIACADFVLGLKESTKVIKHNGATEFSESATGFSEVTDKREGLVKGFMVSCAITEAEARQVLGLAPKEIVALGRHAVVDYEFGKAIHLSESRAIEFAKKGR